MGDEARTPKPLLWGFLAIVALAVVWLVNKIARTDQGDYRLTVLGITLLVMMILIVAFGAWRRGRA